MAKAKKPAAAKAGAKAPAKKPSKAKKPVTKKEPAAKTPKKTAAKKPASKRAAQTITTGVKKDGTKSKHNANTVKGTSKKGLSKKDATALRKKKSTKSKTAQGKWKQAYRASDAKVHALRRVAHTTMATPPRTDAVLNLINTHGPRRGVVKRYLSSVANLHTHGTGMRGYGHVGRDEVKTAIRGLRRAAGRSGYTKAGSKLDKVKLNWLPGRVEEPSFRSSSARWDENHRTALTAQKLARKLKTHGVGGKVIPIIGGKRYHGVDSVVIRGVKQPVRGRPKGHLV